MRFWKNSDDSQDPDDMCVHCHAMIVASGGSLKKIKKPL